MNTRFVATILWLEPNAWMNTRRWIKQKMINANIIENWHSMSKSIRATTTQQQMEFREAQQINKCFVHSATNPPHQWISNGRSCNASGLEKDIVVHIQIARSSCRAIHRSSSRPSTWIAVAKTEFKLMHSYWILRRIQIGDWRWPSGPAQWSSSWLCKRGRRNHRERTV